MATDSITFASDRAGMGFGRAGTPPEKTEQVATALSEPKPEITGTAPEKTKPSKLKSAGNAVADLFMGIGVFLTGGVFGLAGYRRVSALRLIIESGIVAIIAVALYFATKTWLPDGIDLADPLQRAAILVFVAIILAYLGGMVVHTGWNRKGDPKVSMLVLAVGMTLIGLRIASVALAVGEVRTVDAKVRVGEAALTAFKSTIDIMKQAGVDPKPLGAVIFDFQKEVYGSKYVKSFYAASDTPVTDISESDLNLPAPNTVLDTVPDTVDEALPTSDHVADGAEEQPFEQVKDPEVSP